MIRARGDSPVPALAVLAVGVLDVGLEQSIVAPALPAIERHYRASPTAGTWLLTGFLLAAAIAIPLAGRVGDRWGRRRVLWWSLALFAIGSVVSAVASSIGLVIAGRVIQGLGAGAAPLAFALAREHLSATQLPTGVGLIVAGSGLGAVLGFVLGGLLVDEVSVSAIFWMLFVVALLLAALVRLAVHESPARAATPIDLLGALLLATAAGSFMLAISEGNRWGWGSARTVLLLLAALALVGAFVARERFATTPLIDPRALAARPVWSAYAAAIAVGFSLFIALTLVPLLGAYPKATGYGLGLSATQIGFVQTPSAIALLVGAVLGGRFLMRSGARIQLLCSLLMATLTYALLALTTPSVASLTLVTIPGGAGLGLALTAIVNLVALASPISLTASTVSLQAALRTIAAALGAQVAVAVVTSAPPAFPARSAAAHIPAHSGFTSAFWMAAAATIVALPAVALTPSRAASPAEPEAPGVLRPQM